MLSVRHGARAVAFYLSALGATEVFRIDDPEGAATPCHLTRLLQQSATK